MLELQLLLQDRLHDGDVTREVISIVNMKSTGEVPAQRNGVASISSPLASQLVLRRDVVVALLSGCNLSTKKTF